jgi:hypothetical protein
MRIFILGSPHDILIERSNQEREHLKNQGVGKVMDKLDAIPMKLFQ